MAKLMSRGKAGGSNPYIGLGLDESGNWLPGTPPVLSLLSSVLERSIRGNEKLLAGSKIKDGVTLFHGTKEPSLNIRQYVERIFRCYNNAYYAKVGGVSREELNRLEMKLLFDLDFRLHVTTEVFNKYWLKIQQGGDAETQTGTAQRSQSYRLKKDETGQGQRVAGKDRGRPV